jgi:hypothetical protein
MTDPATGPPESVLQDTEAPETFPQFAVVDQSALLPPPVQAQADVGAAAAGAANATTPTPDATKAAAAAAENTVAKPCRVERARGAL